MEYPIDCNTARRKTECLYMVQEDLRLLHNVFSKWLHEGLTTEEYDGVLKKFKDKYPYTEKLSKAAWDKFQEEDFTVRSNKICQEICVQRDELKRSTAFSINIGDV